MPHPPPVGKLASGRAWAVRWGGGRCVRLDPSTGLASGDKVVPQPPPVGSEWSGVGSGVGGVAWLSAHSGPGGSKALGDPSCTGTRAVHGHGRAVCVRARSDPSTGPATCGVCVGHAQAK